MHKIKSSSFISYFSFSKSYEFGIKNDHGFTAARLEFSIHISKQVLNDLAADRKPRSPIPASNAHLLLLFIRKKGMWFKNVDFTNFYYEEQCAAATFLLFLYITPTEELRFFVSYFKMLCLSLVRSTSTVVLSITAHQKTVSGPLCSFGCDPSFNL